MTNAVREFLPILLLPLLMSCGAESYSSKQELNGAARTISGHPVGQETPTKVLEKLHFAILNKDRARFMECYQVPPNGEVFLKYFFDMWTAKFDFLAAIEVGYGSDGLAYFTDLRTAKEPGMIILVSPPLHSPWWESERIRMRVDDNEVTYRDPFFFAELKMTRVSGVWRITPFIPKNVDWEIRYEEMAVESMRVCSDDIGKPGVSLDDIRRRLGKFDREATNKLGHR